MVGVNADAARSAAQRRTHDPKHFFCDFPFALTRISRVCAGASKAENPRALPCARFSLFCVLFPFCARGTVLCCDFVLFLASQDRFVLIFGFERFRTSAQLRPLSLSCPRGHDLVQDEGGVFLVIRFGTLCVACKTSDGPLNFSDLQRYDHPRTLWMEEYNSINTFC